MPERQGISILANRFSYFVGDLPPQAFARMVFYSLHRPDVRLRPRVGVDLVFVLCKALLIDVLKWAKTDEKD